MHTPSLLLALHALTLLAGAKTTSSSSSSAAKPSASSALKFPAPAISGAVSGVRYTHVGGTGTYQQVTAMNPGSWPTCGGPPCTQKTVTVSGPLAPFDDQMSFVFANMDVHNVAVLQPQGGAPNASQWNLVSSFAAGSPMNNMVWMNNMGGGSVSGEWDICNGASQSYADPSFMKAASNASGIFSGVIPPGYQANIMTAAPCTTATCPGYFRGVANQGWAGAKLMVAQFSMPPTAASQTPALWALNAQVLRAAQYGCNCRGMGGAGGCGELDIFEVVPSIATTSGISEIYSFKGATGTGANNFFVRPTSGTVTYATLFDVQTDTISILRLDGYDFGTKTMARSVIDQFVNAQAMTASFGGSKRRHARGAYKAMNPRHA